MNWRTVHKITINELIGSFQRTRMLFCNHLFCSHLKVVSAIVHILIKTL